MVRFENLNIETIDVEEGIRQIIDKEPLDELAASITLHDILSLWSSSPATREDTNFK